MEPGSAFYSARALPNLLAGYVYGAMVMPFCLTLAIVLSCSRGSAQALEDPQAQYNRGNDYWYGNGVPQDYAEAANWFRKSAEQGYAEAQYHLGQMLAIGQGIPRDDAEAAAWYRKIGRAHV